MISRNGGGPAGAGGSPIQFCSRCGNQLTKKHEHAECAKWLATEEPPRYCDQCGRRMQVQITPVGWDARCSRHGVIGPGL